MRRVVMRPKVKKWKKVSGEEVLLGAPWFVIKFGSGIMRENGIFRDSVLLSEAWPF
jgi:hypothetical protein